MERDHPCSINFAGCPYKFFQVAVSDSSTEGVDCVWTEKGGGQRTNEKKASESLLCLGGKREKEDSFKGLLWYLLKERRDGKRVSIPHWQTLYWIAADLPHFPYVTLSLGRATQPSLEELDDFLPCLFREVRMTTTISKQDIHFWQWLGGREGMGIIASWINTFHGHQSIVTDKANQTQNTYSRYAHMHVWAPLKKLTP